MYVLKIGVILSLYVDNINGNVIKVLYRIKSALSHECEMEHMGEVFYFLVYKSYGIKSVECKV